MSPNGRHERPCGPHQRRWHNRCVDTNLQDDWLEVLYNLRVLRVFGLREGRPASPGRMGRPEGYR